MRKNREVLAKIFFIIFAFSIVFSYVFGMYFLGHDCIGDNCRICYEINLMRNIFDNLLILSLFYIFINKLNECISKLKYIFNLGYSLSPIKLKVKLIE